MLKPLLHIAGEENPFVMNASAILPTPWKRSESIAVGGLEEVGYAEDSDLLLVVSNTGRGVFDCLTGKRLARTYDLEQELPDIEWTTNEIKLVAPGIGPLAGESIRMAGLLGGGLLHGDNGGWSLEAVPGVYRIANKDYPAHHLFLQGNWQRGDNTDSVLLATEMSLRTFGFSQTGRSFIIATSSDITIYTKAV